MTEFESEAKDARYQAADEPDRQNSISNSARVHFQDDGFSVPGGVCVGDIRRSAFQILEEERASTMGQLEDIRRRAFDAGYRRGYVKALYDAISSAESLIDGVPDEDK